MRMLPRLLLLFILCVLPFAAFAKNGVIQFGDLKVAYWAPPESKDKQPLILFSHGFAGCMMQSSFLMKALAADGYWVFAPNHADSICGGSLDAEGTKQALAQLMQPAGWDDTSRADRRDDMNQVLGALQHDPRFKDKIDFARIGLVGHSLGGYTVLGLAGAWPSWKMPGVKAVLALSPFSQPFNLQHALGNIDVPVMFQGGTQDFPLTPLIAKAGGSYDQAKTPKYFINFFNADHLAWTDRVIDYQSAIISYSRDFLDHYVKDQPAPRNLTGIRPQVAEYRYDSELGSSVPMPPPIAPNSAP